MNEEIKMELETDTKTFSTDSSVCAIKVKHSCLIEWKTVEHIPRVVSHYVYFFVKEGNEKVLGTLKSLKCKVSRGSSYFIDICMYGEGGNRYYGEYL